MGKKTAEDWVKCYAEWEKSKLKQREYCQLNNLKYITFREKIYALRKKGLIAPVISKKTKGGSLKRIARFQEIVVAELKEEKVPYCEIKFGETHSIKISSQESLLSLRRMLQCLTQA